MADSAPVAPAQLQAHISHTMLGTLQNPVFAIVSAVHWRSIYNHSKYTQDYFMRIKTCTTVDELMALTRVPAAPATEDVRPVHSETAEAMSHSLIVAIMMHTQM